MRPDIYIAIMVAAARGRGLHLSADEVAELAADDAIEARAANGLDEQDWPKHNEFAAPKWASIDPNKRRGGDNLTCTAPEDRVVKSYARS
jgi:hypothetical protein